MLVPEGDGWGGGVGGALKGGGRGGGGGVVGGRGVAGGDPPSLPKPFPPGNRYVKTELGGRSTD